MLVISKIQVWVEVKMAVSVSKGVLVEEIVRRGDGFSRLPHDWVNVSGCLHNFV